jgi:hypothetical protein
MKTPPWLKRDRDRAPDQAVHQFVPVRTRSQQGKNTRDITGILRLSDVAETIFGMVKQCPVQAN